MSLIAADGAAAALWLAVVASGLYHGLNPGMGWPLAVSAGLMERRATALFAALMPLALGHAAAMLVVLLPFVLLTYVISWQQQIQIAASLIVIAFGAWRLVDQRHPRLLARIPPSRLGLWSFAIAIAHGAGLMLVPIYLGLCRTQPNDVGHAAAVRLMASDGVMALLVSVVHSSAMICAGGICAFLVYKYLGLQFISRGWFNLEKLWACSLIAVGAFSLAVATVFPH
jgi:hypothetical protein